MIRCILISCIIFTLSSFVYAMTEQEAKIVSDSVLEICRGGSLQGEGSSVQIKGEGKVTTVLLKKLADVGLSGEAEFSKEEWKGIKPLLPESFDAKAYVKCVTELTPIFVDKFATSIDIPPPDPVIATFEVSPSVIKEGDTALLSWAVQDALSVALEQGIENVPLKDSRMVSPKTTTLYNLIASSEDVTHQATKETVTPLTWEDKNSIGLLQGDDIYSFGAIRYTNNSLIAELSYLYNPQHGQVWIDGYLLNDNGQSISNGFWPTGADQTMKIIKKSRY